MKSKIVCYLTALLMSSVVYSQERTVLRVWDDPQRVDFLNDSVKPFEEMYNCDVIFEPVGLHNQVRRFLALPPNATKPDIILLPSDGVAEAHKLDLIAPIQFMQVDAPNYLSNAISAISFDGNCYSVPKAIETLVVYYNKKYLKMPLESCADYHELSLKRKAEGRYGLIFNYSQFYSIFPLMAANGAYVFKNHNDAIKDYEEYGLDNEGAVNSFKYLRKIHGDGILPALPSDPQDAFDELFNLFVSEKADAVIDGPWNLSKYMKSGIDFGIASLPDMTNGNALTPFLSVKGWSILKSSQNIQLCENLLRYLNSTEVAENRYLITKEIPPIVSVLKSSNLSDDILVNAIAVQTVNSVNMPSSSKMVYIWEFMDQALKELYETDLTEEYILMNAHKKFDSVSEGEF
ncbi:extracellular solute-binding protein [Succinivibrio sp.]|uniref:sugar ABC transporter substrate-binding protein n=1 Tax=Succinivibrio sp. TaxID=2053619 RepID=UPI003869CFF2